MQFAAENKLVEKVRKETRLCFKDSEVGLCILHFIKILPYCKRFQDKIIYTLHKYIYVLSKILDLMSLDSNNLFVFNLLFEIPSNHASKQTKKSLRERIKRRKLKD